MVTWKGKLSSKILIITLILLIVVLSGGFYISYQSKRTAEKHNLKRQSDVSTLLYALVQLEAQAYAISEETEGKVFNLLYQEEPRRVSSEEVDLCSELIPEFISEIPVDPSINQGKSITNCSDFYDTGYTVNISSTTVLTVGAPNAELNQTISKSFDLSSM